MPKPKSSEQFLKEPIYFQCDDHFNNLKSLFHYIEPFGKWKVSIDFKGSPWSVAVKEICQVQYNLQHWWHNIDYHKKKKKIKIYSMVWHLEWKQMAF